MAQTQLWSVMQRLVDSELEDYELDKATNFSQVMRCTMLVTSDATEQRARCHTPDFAPFATEPHVRLAPAARLLEFHGAGRCGAQWQALAGC